MLSDDPNKLYLLSGCLRNYVSMLKMHFLPSESNILLQDWIDSKSELIRTRKELGEVPCFIFCAAASSDGDTIK